MKSNSEAVSVDAACRISRAEVALADWHRRRFGLVVDPLRTVAKLTEEVGELAKAVLRDDRENAVEEIADCANVLCHLARHFGTTLIEAVEKKLPVLEDRLRKRAKEAK